VFLIIFEGVRVFVYLLGHVAIGYILARLVAKEKKRTLVIWAVFMSSVLPDFDVLFYKWGLVHGSYTHSLALLVPVSIIIIVWRKNYLPYIVALLSHVFIDTLIGPLQIFRPLSYMTFSLNLGMSSNTDALIEVASLVVFIVLIWRDGNLKRLLSENRPNLLMIFPLIPVAGSMWRAAGRIGVWRGFTILSYGPQAPALILITIGHIVLLMLMTYSFLHAINSIHKTY
jgi:hypothetical protein